MLFGKWMLILENWALCPGDGYLTNNGKKDGRPVSPVTFMGLFGGSVEGFSRCLKVATDLGLVKDTIPLYQIVDYERHFENYKSKTIERCSWFAMPNKHGGVGWSNLMARPNGAVIYGIWVCLVQLCSRQRLPRCGYLTADGKRDGRRYSVSELARLFRRPEMEIRQCFAAVTRPEIDFIRLLDGEAETADGRIFRGYLKDRRYLLSRAR